MPRSPSFHLLLLRHGQTDANATGVLQGHQPTPLNEIGRLQARRLAERIARHRPTPAVLISSDLARAEQTAEIIAEACGLAPVYDPAWRERGFGKLEGSIVGEREVWRAAHGETDPPGGEPLDVFRARIRGAFESIVREYGSQPAAAVVTHGGPVGVLLLMLTARQLPLAGDSPAFKVAGAPNCSVLELVREPTAKGPTWRVSCVNDVSHLEGLVTATDSG